VKSARACPICTNCGSKKFERIVADDVMVRCVLMMLWLDVSSVIRKLRYRLYV